MYIINIDEVLNKKEIDVFNCGSPNLCKFLVSNDCYPVKTDLARSYTRDGQVKIKPRYIWTFIKTKKLTELLIVWKDTKPVGKGK